MDRSRVWFVTDWRGEKPWTSPVIGAAVAGFFTRWLYQDELVAVQTVVVEEEQAA
ncbi:MAG TPA: hypothetical protein VJX94_21195 [Stellaceae bacterium]|nr:hypothetical protein [Stellaceae bacterium]